VNRAAGLLTQLLLRIGNFQDRVERMPEQPCVSALIPAFNEAELIGKTVRAVKSIPEVMEVIVVNDASTDLTSRIAREAGARVLTLERNMGKGNAMNEGAFLVRGKVVVLLDGDLGDTAGEARKLILPVLEKRADMTIARFPPPRQKGGFGLVKGLARGGIKFLTGLHVSSPLSGQRAMTREVMNELMPFASGYGVEVALTIKAARKGFRVMEVPVMMRHDETGRDLRGFLHRGRQFVHVARVLVGCLGRE